MSESSNYPTRHEGIVLVSPHGARCPDSWWAQAGTRDEFNARWQARLPAMKKLRQAGYGRVDGVDAQ